MSAESRLTVRYITPILSVLVISLAALWVSQGRTSDARAEARQARVEATESNEKLSEANARLEGLSVCARLQSDVAVQTAMYVVALARGGDVTGVQVTLDQATWALQQASQCVG